MSDNNPNPLKRIKQHLVNGWHEAFDAPSQIEGRFDFTPRHYRAEHEAEEQGKQQAVDFWISQWERRNGR